MMMANKEKSLTPLVPDFVQADRFEYMTIDATRRCVNDLPTQKRHLMLLINRVN